MIEISRHIEILLLDNECVIVPGLGGFMAHYSPAELVENEGLFCPPCRTIGFNPQLQLNDSLLAQSYVEAYDLSYPEAIRRISGEVEEIKQQLGTVGGYEFHGIGVLKQTSETGYDFIPCTAGLLTPELYALNSFLLSGIEPLRSTVEVNVQPANQIETCSDKVVEPEFLDDNSYDENSRLLHVHISEFKSIAMAAVMLCLFVLSSIPLGNGTTGVEQCSVLNPELISKIVKNNDVSILGIADKDSVFQNKDVKVEEMNSRHAAAKIAESHYYVLVVAARVSKSGAEEMVLKLKKSGFKDTDISERSSSRKVVYGHYNSEMEAIEALEGLRNQDITFTDAWISKI